MTSIVKGVFIVGAKRTAFGTFGGKLTKVHITELQTIASKAALAAANVKPESVDSTVIGNVMTIDDSCRRLFKNNNMLTVGTSSVYYENSKFLITHEWYFNSFKMAHELNTFETSPQYNAIKFYNHLPQDFKDMQSSKGLKGSSSAPDGIFLPRHVALKCGIPVEKPAYLVNRLCGSGFQTIINGIQEILTGAGEIILTGGVENMSAAPHIVRNIRFGNIPLGISPALEDSLWIGLTDSYCKLPMALTAEKLGEQYKITRDEADAFSLRSQQLWKIAQDAGIFKEEITPVSIKVKKETISFEVDEHPRSQTTLEDLKKLPTLFKQNGLVTAGSASGICDGAAAVVLASEAAVSKNNLKPLARVIGYSVVGVEPSIMGIGPAPAIKNLLRATGKSLNDVDLVEINEAFAAQTLSCAKELNLDISKLNVDGGAIALGHPLGASGSRITGHLVHELRRRNAKLGIGSACIGGGQGIAVMVEAL